MLSTREKNFAATVLFFLIGGMMITAVYGAHRFASETELLNPKMVLSRDSYLLGSDSAYSAFDRKKETAWTERLTSPSEKKAYISAELGLTHFPGRPPSENMPVKLIVYSGHHENPQRFREYARPRTVVIRFYFQEKVDVDREYRLPGPLQFRSEKKVILPDTMEPVILPADFLKGPGSSPKFPVNVHQIWLQMEVLDVYPGSEHRDTFAVSEIDYITPLPDHQGVSP